MKVGTRSLVLAITLLDLANCGGKTAGDSAQSSVASSVGGAAAVSTGGASSGGEGTIDAGQDAATANCGDFCCLQSSGCTGHQILQASSTQTLVYTCDIQLSSYPSVPPNEVTVALDCNSVPPVPGNNASPPDGGTADGFIVDYSQSPPHVRICGSYCDQISQHGAYQVDVIYNCTH